ARRPVRRHGGAARRPAPLPPPRGDRRESALAVEDRAALRPATSGGVRLGGGRAARGRRRFLVRGRARPLARRGDAGGADPPPPRSDRLGRALRRSRRGATSLARPPRPRAVA